jgi:prepilin-type N-terminal cleavage/methylation domain-containing protein
MHSDTRRSGGFTLVELLVVIAIIAVIAGLVVPALFNARGEASKLECSNNLKNLHTAALSFANKKKKFPVATGKDPTAHESLNVLLKSSYGQDLKPDLFVCPEGEATAAQAEDDSDPATPPFLLEPDNLSYMWLKTPTSPARSVPLACDKYVAQFEYADGRTHAGHKSTLVIVDTGGARKEIDVLDDDDKAAYKLDEDLVPEGLTR